MTDTYSWQNGEIRRDTFDITIDQPTPKEVERAVAFDSWSIPDGTTVVLAGKDDDGLVRVWKDGDVAVAVPEDQIQRMDDATTPTTNPSGMPSPSLAVRNPAPIPARFVVLVTAAIIGAILMLLLLRRQLRH